MHENIHHNRATLSASLPWALWLMTGLFACSGNTMEKLPEPGPVTSEPPRPMSATPAAPEVRTAQGVDSVREGLKKINALGPRGEEHDGPSIPYTVELPGVGIASVDGGGLRLSFQAAMTGIRVLRFSPVVKLHCALDGDILASSRSFALAPKESTKLSFPFFVGTSFGSGQLHCQVSFDYEKGFSGERARDPFHFCLSKGVVARGKCTFKRPALRHHKAWLSRIRRTSGTLHFLISRGDRLLERDAVNLRVTAQGKTPVLRPLSHILSGLGPLESAPVQFPWTQQGAITVALIGKPILGTTEERYGQVCLTTAGTATQGPCPQKSATP